MTNNDLDTFKDGVSNAKEIIIELKEKMDNLYLEGDDVSEALLAHRAVFILDIIENLGDLTQYQIGVVSALLEYIEINTDCDLKAEDWRPTALTGKWQ